MRQGCKTVLMLFLGIFFGFLLTVGGIALGGYWAYNNLTLNNIQGVVGSDLDLGEYSDKPIKDLVGEVSNIANMTVKEIDSKFLDGAIKNNLTISINGKDIDLTQNIFKDVFNAKVTNAPDKLANIKDNLTFGFIYQDILLEAEVQLPDNSPLLQKFKNTSIEQAIEEIGEEKIQTIVNEDHTFENKLLDTVFDAVKDLKINELSDSNKLDIALDSMKINDLLELDSSSTGILKALYLEDLTLGEVKQNSTYDNLSINDILELDSSSSGVLGAIYEKNWTLADLKNSNNFNSLNVGKILNISSTATGFLGALKTWSLSDITNDKINTLTLGAILNINNSATGILGAIKDWKLNELNNTKFLNLEIKTILEIEDSENGILGKIKNWKLNELTNDNLNDLISNLTIGELVEDGMLTITDYNAKKGTMIGSTTLENTTLEEFINHAVSAL